MSYILDALRKAEAQRQRDPARDVLAPAGAPPGLQEPALLPLGWLLGGCAAVLLGAALAWWAWPRTAASVVQAVPAPPAGVVPARLPPAPVEPAAAVAAAPAATASVPVARPSPAAPASAPALPAAAPAVTVAPAAGVAGPAVGAAQGPAVVPASASGPAGGAPESRVVTLEDLPADVRQSLPRLAISGGVYSANASARMLIVGGQVAAEGSEVAPGVVLEQIRSKSAVLRFRGWRFSVGW